MLSLRRVVALVAGVALASGMASAISQGVSPESAVADSPVVLVSTDGVTYLPNLLVGLFDSVGLMVPGDTATSELWIKNPTDSPATVRVNIGDVSSTSVELANNLQLTAVNSVSGASVTETWSQLAQCDVMVQPITIAAGAVLRIDLSLSMLNAPGLVAQHQDGALTADVSMRDAAAGSFPASTCDPAGASPTGTEPAATSPRRILGYTGETFPTQLLLLGSILVGVGWFLVVARRRRRRAEARR
jgi:LPXTG-motif cell wall-anchored protein